MERRYLSIRELSEYIGVTVGTLYSWVCYRKIPFSKVGRLVKFDKLRIDQWVQERTIDEIR